MKAGGGKAKGSSFERKICKALSLWVTYNERDDVLWRSALSGGRFTNLRKKQDTGLEHVAGDICAVHADGYAFVDWFYVECKTYKKFDWHRLLDDHGGTLAGFWIDTVKKAAEVHKQPLLIFRQNGGDCFVAVSQVQFRDWEAMRKYPKLVFAVHITKYPMFVYRLSSVVKSTRPWVNQMNQRYSLPA